MLQEAYKIGSIADFLRVQYNLVRLTRLSEASDDLIGDVCTKIYAECESQIMKTDNISKFLAAGKLQRPQLSDVSRN